MPCPPTPNPLPVLGIMNTTGFGFHPHSLSFGVAMAPNSNENGQFYHSSRNRASRTGPPNAEKSHTRSQSHFTQCCKHGWVIPPPTPLPHPPFPPETGVRGAGSAQVQIRSYRNRQSGNLARKVRNAFLGLMALSRICCS